MNTYDVAYDTARNDLLHLAKLGYLEKMQFKRKFVFRLAKKNGL
jgi:Fic family protein